MSMEKKDLMNELYDATLITLGAVAVSMVSKRVVREQLGTPTTMRGTLKLAAAVRAGTVGVKYMQSKKWIPTDPFKQ